MRRKRMPVWAWILICIGCALFGAAVVYILLLAYLAKAFRW